MDTGELAERLANAGHGFPAALALLSPDGDQLLTHGCTVEADFEIGSITKGITGLLYVDAVERGEATPDTTLGGLLDVGGRAAGIRLADLATHHSGLPRVLIRHSLRRSWGYLRRGTNPYDAPVSELLELVPGARLGRTGKARYSNAGFQLLGLALARASGLSYADLVEARVATPLALSPFYPPGSADQLLPTALAGHNRGSVVDPWTGAAIAPAGGIRASIASMARLARALLDGSAPGISALDPVADFAGSRVRIGAAWIVTDRKDRGVLTWHNGGTGGFRSYLGLLRDEGRAVVALGSTTHSVDALALSVLDLPQA